MEIGKTEETKGNIEITFSTLIFSIGSAALCGLGIIPNPATGKVEKNLQMAKHNIDLLALLREKTKGNLSQEEELLLENILSDARLKYVETLTKAESGEKKTDEKK
ncbi:MAG: DUF1844 domain-containing protein [Deltaproteobacteria bacterium]|nr:DUF1844 domain-containing protein [Deltaproteobacteria bacterium]